MVSPRRGPVRRIRGTLQEELHGNAALQELRALAKQGPVTLVTATRDLDISQAAVLAKLLKPR